MALIESLLAEIPDPGLRSALEREVRSLKQRKEFGLVFERHIPETVLLPPSVGLEVGTEVKLRQNPGGETRYFVKQVMKTKARIAAVGQGTEKSVPLKDLRVVRRFDESVCPTIKRLGGVTEGGARDSHLVIEAENFDALQLLRYTHANQIDVIYIDPPYNKGARDWKYNNNYVDQDDRYRHSKWLAMMERRLRLAKHLLRPEDSCLIVTIDETEYLRLGLLLEQIFRGCRIQMVSSLINPAAQTREGAGFGRSDEYLFFVMLGSAAPKRTLLPRDWVTEKGRTHTGEARWDLLRRSGTQGSSREDSPGCFYPIYVDPDGPKFHSIGEPLPDGVSEPDEIPGTVAVLPIRKDGSEGRWQLSPQMLRQYMDQGRVRIGGDKERGFVIYYMKPGEYDKVLNGEYPITGRRPDGSIETGGGESGKVMAIPSTQWRIPSHDATQYGSRLIQKLIPGRKFQYPKSLYAVEDTLRFFVQDKPTATILDFFAGSGTTAHAVMRLNREDGGQRRSISVTNNELSEKEAKKLARDGFAPGDEAWEAQGICRYITVPRIVAAITGRTPEGEQIPGDYIYNEEFPIREGLKENVDYVKLEYLNPDEVEVGHATTDLLPVMWLKAGAHGPMPQAGLEGDYQVFRDARFAVLLNDAAFRDLIAEIGDDEDITHVFLFTDYNDTYAALSTRLADRVVEMMPREYLEWFRRHGREAG